MIETHFDRLKKLVELEEAEEITSFREEFLKRTPEEREAAGRALLRLSVVDSHYSPAGHRLLQFEYAREIRRRRPRPLPLHSLDVGDPVSLCPQAEADSAGREYPFGTVYEKSRDSITVAFNRDLPDWVTGEGVYDLNLAGNRATYKKTYQALKQVRDASHSRLAKAAGVRLDERPRDACEGRLAKAAGVRLDERPRDACEGRLAYLRDVFLGLKKPAEGDAVRLDSIRFFNSGLNARQKEAVRLALEMPDVAIIHGPPGTGKTTALVEIARQAVSRRQFVFASAPSNTACDHLLECLIQAGIAALRLGHPARILAHLRDHTLDFKLARHPQAVRADEIEAELERLGRRFDRHLSRHVLSREEKQSLSQERKSLRGELSQLEADILSQVLREAPCIVGTHASADDRVLKGKVFDLLILDEASQATEPLSWIPLVQAKKVILAGDHFQLPPTVRSQEAEKKGLGVTLFERLHGILDGKFRVLLNVQYRMHEHIMNFSSRKFYGGELAADPSVRHHTLSGLAHVKRNRETEEPLVFLDTAGRGFEEILEPGSQSRYNPEEAKLVLHELGKLLASGVRPEAVAVISPYSAQTRLLASRSPDPAVEMDSVDGFQGREKEAVILSLVRSNVMGEMGFLIDTRRMNVAMTRAKRKLIVIGDSATLSSIPFYRDFIEYAESVGAYRSSWG